MENYSRVSRNNITACLYLINYRSIIESNKMVARICFAK